jgi:hypothetical protein
MNLQEIRNVIASAMQGEMRMEDMAAAKFELDVLISLEQPCPYKRLRKGEDMIATIYKNNEFHKDCDDLFEEIFRIVDEIEAAQHRHDTVEADEAGEFGEWLRDNRD